MLVKELPEGTNLTEIKVILPDDVLEKYKAYCGGEKEMYIAGSMMGDFFLSPNPKTDGKGERRLYPMPETIDPSDILEWEVVK